MGERPSGICPHCERRRGEVGAECPGEDCRARGYRFIPVPWYQSARDFAYRKGRPLDPLLGRVLERYLLAGKLGEGGMGAVYLAYQQPLMREVALKVISGLELTRAARARFEREARAISVLDHPNIVRLYDYGIARLEFEVPFMALEYVKHGRTLRRALADERQSSGGQIPGEVILTIFEQVLNALAAAHEIGLVHRDMKPDNVMITRVHGNPYFVKVLDFGLAKAVQEVSGFTDGDVSHSGQILGTPYYMAPEQMPKPGGPRVDARTDLYAVAVMLFEIFTGVRPFEGGTPLEIMIRKTEREHWPLDLPAARVLTRPMREFLERGLQPRQEDRFQSAGEMLQAFRQALAGRTLTAVGLDWLKAGSSEDRPATPQSPAGREVHPEQESIPTVPARDLEAREGLKPVERTRVGTLHRRWPWVTAPILAAVIVGGVYLGLTGGRRVEVGSEAPKGTETVAVQVPEPVKPPEEPRAEPPPAQDGVLEVPAPLPVRRFAFEVRTRPQGAQIRVDGRVIGTSPVRYEFEVSKDADLDRVVEIVATLAGFREATKAVRLRDAIAGGVDLLLSQVRKPKPAAPTSAPRRLKLL